MSQYIKFDFKAAAQLQEDNPATLATSATQQRESSERSGSSTGMPSLSPCSKTENGAQRRAEMTSGALHQGDREPAISATVATHEGHSSASSKSSHTSPFEPWTLEEPMWPSAPPYPGPPTDYASPILEERWDLPPCRNCGGRVRWLNAKIVAAAPWFMHCARCSPPPSSASGAIYATDPAPAVTPQAVLVPAGEAL
jgi:hypothetical protein